ncbi:hypothetical protein [Bradyrhizobium sp. STM 3557]|uniref:hypothetical protein n=1 Tax=Bradyrhizobium sp. STM 3557 TaxID=578920 RepID=UPI00388D548D
MMIFLCALAAPSEADDAVSQTGLQAIEGSYHRLISALESARSDAAARQTIAKMAQDFRDALKRDGGARPSLEGDATNIIKSLSDGTFSAERSVQALRRDAKGSVIDFGSWRPALGGTAIPGDIGTHLNQTHEGDCVGVSVLKAFSTTRAGAELLHGMVTRDNDGNHNVSLPGDPSTLYRLAAGDLDQYGTGEPAAAAVVGALYRYFHLDPKHASLPTNKVMELLAGRFGDHARLADAETSPAGLTDFLMKHANRVGVDVAMVFGGKPGPKGEWSKGDGHAFAVLHINAATGTLTYTNPWDQARQTRTIAIADLARQAAGTSADFETITFR